METAVNLHHLSYEEINEIASTLDTPDKIEEMIQSIERLEKSIRMIRRMLKGKRVMVERNRREERRKRLRLVEKK